MNGSFNSNSKSLKECPAVSNEEYRDASEAARSSTANITQGRHATKKLPLPVNPEQEVDIEDLEPFEDLSGYDLYIQRRDGLRIRKHLYSPSNGSDILGAEKPIPGQIETNNSIKRMLDFLRIKWNPTEGDDGWIEIVEPEPDAKPDDQTLGYSLCTVNGTISLRIWKQAVTIFSGIPRKNEDQSDMIRAAYVPLSESVITRVQERLQELCISLVPDNFEEGKYPRAPKFDRKQLGHIMEEVASINGSVNPALEIAQTVEWDGKERMAGFFQKLGYTVPPECGLSEGETEYYLQCCSRWTFLGLMERQLRKTLYDLILILWKDGPDGGGVGKSMTVRAIANGFVGLAGRMPSEKTATTDREFWKATIGHVACEMAEGQQFTRGNKEAIKALADQSEFTFVEKYQVNPQTHNVGCIFVCTTNSKEIIRDPDGNTRRFLPLMASMTIDEEYAKDVLLRLEKEEPGYFDQIHAEAYNTIKSSDKRQVWRYGTKKGIWAYNDEFRNGLQARVCSESLEKDPTVMDLAGFIHDKLTSDSLDCPEVVSASQVETEYRISRPYEMVSESDFSKARVILHTSGAAKLYGLRYYVSKLDGKSNRCYKLLDKGDLRKTPDDPKNTRSDGEPSNRRG